MKTLPITEVIKRKEQELEQITEEAWLKYKTRKVHKLREQRTSGEQQFQDKKAIAFQMETLQSTLVYLRQLASTAQFVARQEPTLKLEEVKHEESEPKRATGEDSSVSLQEDRKEQ